MFPTAIKIEICEEDTLASTAPLKRQLSVQSPETPEMKPLSPAQGPPTKRPCSAVANIETAAPTPSSKSLVIAICPVDYPANLLTPDQMDAVTMDIMDLIVQNRKEDVKPKFSNSVRKLGFLAVVCKDDSTRDWLVEHVPSLIPWEGAKLHAVDQQSLTHPIRAVAFIKNGTRHKTAWIMSLLEGQNRHYNFKHWCIIKRLNLGPNSMLVWAIDQSSADLLKKGKNELSFFFGSLTVGFKTADQILNDKLVDEMRELDRQVREQS